MRYLAVLLAVISAPAFAQVTGLPPVGAEADAQIERAVGLAMAEAEAALADGPTPEALDDAIAEAGTELAEAAAGLDAAEPGLAALEMELQAALAESAQTDEPRTTAPRRTLRGPQTFPVIPDGYGAAGDGFPSQTVVSGTIVAAGSLRLCRPGRPPVSRWLQVRLDGTPEAYPPVYFVVAVECHEEQAARLVGRHVRMEAWKSAPDAPVRMATVDVPETDAPLYVSYAGNVALDR